MINSLSRLNKLHYCRKKKGKSRGVEATETQEHLELIAVREGRVAERSRREETSAERDGGAAADTRTLTEEHCKKVRIIVFLISWLTPSMHSGYFKYILLVIVFSFFLLPSPS